MRVALNVEQLLYRAPGGIGRYTSKLLTLLPSLSPDDTVVPFTARHSPAEVDLTPTAGSGSSRRPGPSRCDSACRGRCCTRHGTPSGSPSWNGCREAFDRVDVVHAPSLAVPPRRSRRRRPLVVTVHDVAPALFPETFPRHGRWFHARGLAAAARRADLVITVSLAAAAEIAEHSAIGSDRVRVVPNGVDATLATADEVAATRNRYGLADAPYVLWVGSREPRKNLRTLVSAFARLVASSKASPTSWRWSVPPVGSTTT